MILYYYRYHNTMYDIAIPRPMPNNIITIMFCLSAVHIRENHHHDKNYIACTYYVPGDVLHG